MATKRSPLHGKAIRVKHLRNSLYQIEIWTRTVRRMLYSLDPEMVVDPGHDLSLQTWGSIGPPKQKVGCPPPVGEEVGCTCECHEDKEEKDKKEKKPKKVKTSSTRRVRN